MKVLCIKYVGFILDCLGKKEEGIRGAGGAAGAASVDI